MTSTGPDFDFGVARLGQDRAGDLLGVKPVRFAVTVASGTVGRVDLSDLLPGGCEEAGQRRAEVPRALDTDSPDLAVRADPGQQDRIAALAGAKLPVPEQPAMAIDHCCVMRVLVGIDTADDNSRCTRHGGSAPP
jgi:hypothetical protein